MEQLVFLSDLENAYEERRDAFKAYEDGMESYRSDTLMGAWTEADARFDRAMEAFARQHDIPDGGRDRLQRALEACMRMKHEAWVAYARDLERAVDTFYDDVDRLSEGEE